MPRPTPRTRRPIISREEFVGKPPVVRLKGWEEPANMRKLKGATFRQIPIHPSFFRMRASEKAALRAVVRALKQTAMPQAEKAQIFSHFKPGTAIDRNLLGQSLRLYRRSFPREEQQTASTFVDSFWQNLRKSPFANYHFVVAYKRTPEGTPNLVGFSTMHVTRIRSMTSKPRIALSEYLAIAPEFRRRGVMTALLNKRIEIARKQGAEWMIGEKEPWEREHEERLQTLSGKRSLTSDQKTELADLKLRQARMKIFSQWYKHIRGIDYVDPSAGITFPSGDRMAYGKWDRQSANPLWLFARNLQGRTPRELPRRNVKGILNALYRIHWVDPRDQSLLMRRSLPEAKRFGLVDPKRYLKKTRGNA